VIGPAHGHKSGGYKQFVMRHPPMAALEILEFGPV
jgi:hypothetical protein